MRFGGKVFTTILMILSVIVFARPVFAQDENWNWQDGIPKYEEAKVAIVEDGPTLLFSDSPEMVKASGIMYHNGRKVRCAVQPVSLCNARGQQGRHFGLGHNLRGSLWRRINLFPVLGQKGSAADGQRSVPLVRNRKTPSI